MISNQILQSTIDGLKAITKVDISVMDMEGTLLSSTEDVRDEKTFPLVPDLISSRAESMLVQGYQFFKVYDDNEMEYMLFTACCAKIDNFTKSEFSAFLLITE